MTWNYRVIAQASKHKGDVGKTAVHEVYYDDAGQPNGYTTSPVKCETESIEGLKWMVEEFIKALALPVLTAADFEHPNLP